MAGAMKVENHHVVSCVQMDRVVLMLTLCLMAGAMNVENHHVVSCVQMVRFVVIVLSAHLVFDGRSHEGGEPP